ncbi:hypothetical protein BTA51_13765 [Hahella sp. CCB-MM4]|nr:hypothetical protein BTA51_13765 [Hahella sp. CCB-MM4]
MNKLLAVTGMIVGLWGSAVVWAADVSLQGQMAESSAGACPDTVARLTLVTDDYGSETSWQLTDSNFQTLYSGANYSDNTVYTEDFCLANGSYSFTIFDTYGDGICCQYGQGSYAISVDGKALVSGGSFGNSETAGFTIEDSDGLPDLSEYYKDAEGTTGYALKTALYNIIKDHSSQGYSALWSFYREQELDSYFENDGSILDIYSENPEGSDPYVFARSTDQCGSYNSEGDCYNREHSFPRSWFGGAREPMNSDIHHIFATDGYVNAKRGSYPYGEVGVTTYISSNGSKLGAAASGLGYTGTVFEPIDEFKGDVARAYFYMATRYQNVIAGWENNTTYSDAVLNGSSNQVFEPWFLNLLLAWHQQDPVSQKEKDRNEAAYGFQGNRNPFVDYPEFAGLIWGK